MLTKREYAMRAFAQKYATKIFVCPAIISAVLAAYHLYKMVYPTQEHVIRYGVYAALCLVNVYGFLKKPFWFEFFWFFSSTVLFISVNPVTAQDWPDIFSIPFLVFFAIDVLVTVLLELNSNAPSKRLANS